MVVMIDRHRRRPVFFPFSSPSFSGVCANGTGPNSPNLLHVLLPGLAPTADHKSTSGDRAGALLLSIIRGSPLPTLAASELQSNSEAINSANKARQVLLRIIRSMAGPSSGPARSPTLQSPVLQSPAATQSAGAYSAFTSSPRNAFQYDVDRTKESSICCAPGAEHKSAKRQLPSGDSCRFIGSLPSVPTSRRHFERPVGTNSITSQTAGMTAASQPKPTGGEDEQCSDYAASSTTARDTGSVSLDTLSSSETSSRPTVLTAFAVPLFMRSPDPLTVPLPSFSSAAT
eukprot:Gregarina_sp_Poly_1__219@NODE_1051_length_5230_cov_265_105559_g731_i0_p2_GENE_NODE_1051_length_5230_cov_265_105559_g731_i0NODE_1051_length_5230_cov_265_105559_g731_i0_p2_ORF_typecomplete_len287_score26_91_NODE_1051_length_5230_cov_265_105559_g731_i032144074